MLFIDEKAIENNLQKEGATSAHNFKNYAHLGFGGERLLAGGGSSNDQDLHMTDEEIKDREFFVFNLLKWGHLICFTLYVISDHYLKKNGHHNIAEIIDSSIIPWGYVYIIPFNVYITKKHYNEWFDDVNYIRIWLLIEIIWFFSWIMMSILFAMYSYWLKL